MDGENESGSGLSQNGLLVALGVVIITAVGGASVSPSNATQILGFCSLACISLLSLLQQLRSASTRAQQDKKLEKRLEVAAEKVGEVADKAEEVKTALKNQDAKVSDKLDIIHTLVNNDMHKALYVAAEATREKAELSSLLNLPSHAEDVRKAEDAALKLSEHDRRQGNVDTGKPVQ